MKNFTALILCIVALFVFTSCNSADKVDVIDDVRSSSELNLKEIDWTVKINDIDENYNKEAATKNQFDGHIIPVPYDGIKEILTVPISALYKFDSTENLQSVTFSVETDYAEALAALKLLAKTTVTDYDDNTGGAYFMYIGNSRLEVIVDKSDEQLIITCSKPDSFIKSTATHESSFSVNHIDWSMTRDDIKELHKNKICRSDEPEEEYAPLGYSFFSLENIAQTNIDVYYHFNEDSSLRDVVIYFENTDVNWENALKYFNAGATKDKKMTVVEDSNTKAALDVKSDDPGTLLLFAVPVN